MNDFLHKQDVYTLHKPIKKKFKTRRVYVSGIDNQWQTDLAEMHKDKGYKYILTVIDIFSKYAWGIPLKNKTGEEVAKAFVDIFKERRPNKIQSDKGKEFINKIVQNIFKKNDIHWFATHDEKKSQVVERFNRTLKERMYKYFTHNNTRDWIEILPSLVENYNNTYHTSIKMTPIEGSKPENEHRVYYNLYVKDKKVEKSKYEIGETVRISKYKGKFTKGYLPNFTTELFVISDVLKTNPITYKIKDENNEEIEGSFYNEELVKYDKQDQYYKVEKILKTRTRKGKKEYLIKWLGYPESFNSWTSKIIRL